MQTSGKRPAPAERSPTGALSTTAIRLALTTCLASPTKQEQMIFPPHAMKEAFDCVCRWFVGCIDILDVAGGSDVVERSSDVIGTQQSKE